MILVDPLVDWTGMTKLRHKVWCHLVSTISADELHAFAHQLGLKRAWFQGRPGASAAHYDLVPAKRARAIALGAVEVTARQLVIRNFDRVRKGA